MKTLNEYINEAMSININLNDKPKDKEELIKIIKKYIQITKPSTSDVVDLNWIDVSGLDSLGDVFSSNNQMMKYNYDVSKWDVSNVESLHNTFYGCRKFNCDLSKWDVSKVVDMTQAFYHCQSLDCDLSKWNVKNVRWAIGAFGDPCGVKPNHRPKLIDEQLKSNPTSDPEYWDWWPGK